MFKLLKWTIFLPLTLLVVCAVSDTASKAVAKLIGTFIIAPLVVVGLMLWVFALSFSEWGMPQMTIEHEKALIVVKQIDEQMENHERIIKRLTNSIVDGKGQIKQDIRAAQIEGKPMPRKDGAKMSHAGSDWFVKAPFAADMVFENSQAGYVETITKSFKTFAEMEAAIAIHTAEIKRLEVIRKPHYEKHLEFHKVRVEKQVEELGEYWADWAETLRVKIGNEYADNGSHTPSEKKEF